jgi:hypothetical protein
MSEVLHLYTDLVEEPYQYLLYIECHINENTMSNQNIMYFIGHVLLGTVLGCTP